MPDNLSNLLEGLKSVEAKFEIKVKNINNCYQIKLLELMDVTKANKRRCMIVTLCDEPPFYSIKTYKTVDPNSPTDRYEKTYKITVEGNNDYRLIIQDIEDLISGKKGGTFRRSIPL